MTCPCQTASDKAYCPSWDPRSGRCAQEPVEAPMVEPPAPSYLRDWRRGDPAEAKGRTLWRDARGEVWLSPREVLALGLVQSMRETINERLEGGPLEESGSPEASPSIEEERTTVSADEWFEEAERAVTRAAVHAGVLSPDALEPEAGPHWPWATRDGRPVPSTWGRERGTPYWACLGWPFGTPQPGRLSSDGVPLHMGQVNSHAYNEVPLGRACYCGLRLSDYRGRRWGPGLRHWRRARQRQRLMETAAVVEEEAFVDQCHQAVLRATLYLGEAATSARTAWEPIVSDGGAVAWRDLTKTLPQLTDEEKDRLTREAWRDPGPEPVRTADDAIREHERLGRWFAEAEEARGPSPLDRDRLRATALGLPSGEDGGWRWWWLDDDGERSLAYDNASLVRAWWRGYNGGMPRELPSHETARPPDLVQGAIPASVLRPAMLALAEDNARGLARTLVREADSAARRVSVRADWPRGRATVWTCACGDTHPITGDLWLDCACGRRWAFVYVPDETEGESLSAVSGQSVPYSPPGQRRLPRADDDVARWLRARREDLTRAGLGTSAQAVDALLDEYRMHAATGTALDAPLHDPGGPPSTDPASEAWVPDYERAAGGALCECGAAYRDHASTSFGDLVLHNVCPGRWVKL